MKRIPFFHFGFLIIAINQFTYVQPDTYQLVWSDEFNRDGRPDSSNWVYEYGFVRNNEDQWYQEENARCEGGYLILEARRENRPNPWYSADSENWKSSREHIGYTSSCLTTKGKYEWKYGRIEMRAKIDVRPGLWPAFWTLGVNGEWPSNGECDIMEYYRGMLLANFAWGSDKRYQAEWDDIKIPIRNLKDKWGEEFHVWRLDWNEESMRIYMDDRLLNEVDLSDTKNKNAGKNPFQQPHYLLINLAIGGANGGDPSDTEFPARYVIDYVRVYQEK